MNKFSSELKAKLNNKVFNIIRFDRLICTSLCKCEFESNGDQIEFRCKNYNLRIKSDAISIYFIRTKWKDKNTLRRTGLYTII